MIDRALLRTAAESATEAAGSSLARSLHKIPVTIGLSGALGSGKTAFMRGFLRELGVTDGVTSPTYALEQRYDSPRGEVLHVDLYRLDEAEARTILHGNDEHSGIRCIEWPERAGDKLRADINVTITETANDTRDIKITCNDVLWPDDALIELWRRELHLPPNVSAHCDAVADFCERAADALIERGIFVRKHLLRAAAKTHDLLRFIDFHDRAAPAGWSSSTEEEEAWKKWKEIYPQPSHEAAAEAFLIDKGFPILGSLVASHSIKISLSERRTTEEHLLYYADKRFIGDKQVPIADRYADFGQRYGTDGKRSDESHRWEKETLETERLLFPNGAPF